MQLSESLSSMDRQLVIVALEFLARTFEHQPAGVRSIDPAQVRGALEKVKRGFDLVSVVHMTNEKAEG